MDYEGFKSMPPSTPVKTDKHKFVFVPNLSPFPFSPKHTLLGQSESFNDDEFFDISYDVPLSDKSDECHLITENIKLRSSDPLKTMGIDVIRKIGSGSFSEVFEAKNRRGDLYALKIISRKSKRCFKEIQILSTLKNAKHCLLLDSAWEHNSRIFIMTELCFYGSYTMLLNF